MVKKPTANTTTTQQPGKTTINNAKPAPRSHPTSSRPPTTTTTPTTHSTTTTTTTSQTQLSTVPVTNATIVADVQNQALPAGAYSNWDEYKKVIYNLLDLEFGLQSQLSPQNSFKVEWSISQHNVTEFMNLVATLVIPYNNDFIDIDQLKLGQRLQFLHHEIPQFNIHNQIPITGFIDNIVSENDLNQYSVDVIIDLIPTTFLKNSNLILPRFTSTLATSSNTTQSQQQLALQSSLLPQTTSQEAFLKNFSVLTFPKNNYQIRIHTQDTLNYKRIYYALSIMKLPQHLEDTIIGQYNQISNVFEAIGLVADAIPSERDIVRKDVIHATTTIPSIFDQQQVSTLHFAIQQPFCVIQAPPGCGKTEIISTAGLKIQAILKRQYQANQLDDDEYTPVLVTGVNEVSLFNEVGKYIFTRSDDVLVISNTFTTKWLHDPVLRPTLLQSIIANWIHTHPNDLLYSYMCRIFPDYETYDSRQRHILALKLHLIVNDDTLLLNLALPGLENHYVDPDQGNNIVGVGDYFKEKSCREENTQNFTIPQSRFGKDDFLNDVCNIDGLKSTLLFNPYHFYERLSLLFAQDKAEAFNDDEDEEFDDETSPFEPTIQSLSLQDTLIFCEHYHELQSEYISNSHIVCCTNELLGNRLLFQKAKFHHVLMDDTQSVPETISLLALNYGAKQALLSFDNALLHAPSPTTLTTKNRQFTRPIADRLLTLNDWQKQKPLPKNHTQIKKMTIIPTAYCNVQYRVHPRLFEFPYQNHYKDHYPKLLNQLTLPRDVHAKNYDVLFASVYKKDMADRHSECPKQFGQKYFDWAVRRLENDRAGMYNRSLEKFPWPNDQLPFLFLSTHNPAFEQQLKQQGILRNTTNPLEISYTDALLAHFVHLGLNLEDLGIIVPFADQMQAMYQAFAQPRSALTQALYERRLLGRTEEPVNLQLYFRKKLKIALPEHFQSVDCKILIFSTTRTASTTLGPTLANPTIINLAMTRARNAVMFLGDHTLLLSMSSAWTRLISYASENNAIMLPTMAKRFIPWLSVSRSFIYEISRRKKEMILHQFLPQLLAQSVNSPPGSKDPIESKAFKQQLVEFEAFDVLLQYYQNLLSERGQIWGENLNRLDIYDDGFTLQHNEELFTALITDDNIFSTSSKSRFQALLKHFCVKNLKTEGPKITVVATPTAPNPPQVSTVPTPPPVIASPVIVVPAVSQPTVIPVVSETKQIQANPEGVQTVITQTTPQPEPIPTHITIGTAQVPMPNSTSIQPPTTATSSSTTTTSTLMTPSLPLSPQNTQIISNNQIQPNNLQPQNFLVATTSDAMTFPPFIQNLSNTGLMGQQTVGFPVNMNGMPSFGIPMNNQPGLSMNTISTNPSMQMAVMNGIPLGPNTSMQSQPPQMIGNIATMNGMGSMNQFGPGMLQPGQLFQQDIQQHSVSPINKLDETNPPSMNKQSLSADQSSSTSPQTSPNTGLFQPPIHDMNFHQSPLMANPSSFLPQNIYNDPQSPQFIVNDDGMSGIDMGHMYMQGANLNDPNFAQFGFFQQNSFPQNVNASGINPQFYQSPPGLTPNVKQPHFNNQMMGFNQMNMIPQNNISNPMVGATMNQQPMVMNNASMNFYPQQNFASQLPQNNMNTMMPMGMNMMNGAPMSNIGGQNFYPQQAFFPQQPQMSGNLNFQNFSTFPQGQSAPPPPPSSQNSQQFVTQTQSFQPITNGQPPVASNAPPQPGS
jgi:hypothetical protein